MATQYAFGQIVTNGLVLALDAADRNSYVSGSTTWSDLSGNNNSGSLVNGPTFSSANGGSFAFNGSNNYISVNTAASIPTGATARTVNMWFYTNPSTWQNDVNNLFSYGGAATRTSFGIDFSTYPVMEVWTYADDINFSSSFSQTGWKNITVTYNGSTTILIYENGIFTQTKTLAGILNTTANAVTIGAVNPLVIPGLYFTGSIATTQMYNRALSVDEVLQNYNAQKSRFGLT
jgi:hypothetical protein